MVKCYQGKQDHDASGFFFHQYLSFHVGGRVNRLPFAIAMKIKSGNKRKPEPKFMYICNRRRCLHCVPECHHTAQIEYALYKDHSKSQWDAGKDGRMWELKHGS